MSGIGISYLERSCRLALHFNYEMMQSFHMNCKNGTKKLAAALIQNTWIMLASAYSVNWLWELRAYFKYETSWHQVFFMRLITSYISLMSMGTNRFYHLNMYFHDNIRTYLWCWWVQIDSITLICTFMTKDLPAITVIFCQKLNVFFNHTFTVKSSVTWKFYLI